MRTRLGQYLLLTGTISEERLTEALAEQAETGRALGEVLHRRGWITETQLAQTLAAQLELDFVDVRTVTPDPEALRTVPADTATALAALPLNWKHNVLRVALADPLDIDALEQLEQQAHATIEPVVAEGGALATTIPVLYAGERKRQAAMEAARADLQQQAQALRTAGQTPTLVVCAAGTRGIGLTHTVVNIGAAAAAQEHRVLVVDASAGPSNGLAPVGLTTDAVCADLVHTDLPAAGDSWGTTSHGIHVIGGGTGIPLRNATPDHRMVAAGNLVRLATAHDVILCDLGSAPLDGAVEWLLAADVPVVVTTARDIVSTYELLRAAAAERRQRYPAERDPEPWDLGIVVTFAQTGAAGREVFDHLAAAVRRHVNRDEVTRSGQLRLGLLGTIPFDRDTAAAAETAGTPAVRGIPDTDLAQGAEDVTQAVLERVRRATPRTWPLAELIALAGTTPDRRR